MEVLCTGSSSELTVKVVPSDSNTILDGMRDSIGNYSILFPATDHEQAICVIKKHTRVVEPSIVYNHDDDVELCEPIAVMYSSIYDYPVLIFI